MPEVAKKMPLDLKKTSLKVNMLIKITSVRSMSSFSFMGNADCFKTHYLKKHETTFSNPPNNF